MAGRTDINMTEGAIWKRLITFAVPLLIGNLFQQLYNTVDSIVVGNFVSKQALAAVGSVGPVINTLVGFFSGLATGAGVVISQYYGAKDDRNLSNAVQTSVSFSLLCCVFCTVVGVLFVPMMLNLMNTPDDVFNESATYLRIYFFGISATLMYNIGAGILRAVGDSRHPLYYLCASTVTNIVLDLVFVIQFHWGIAGVAWATVLSQVISAILVFGQLIRSKAAYRVQPRHLRIDRRIMGSIVRIGLPGGIQMAITSFSNVFVQGYFNQFGSDVMAGYTSYVKLDQFIMLPMQSISLSSTTFVGQNLGAGNVKRAKDGVRFSLSLSLLVTAVLSVLLIGFARPLLTMFSSEPSVLDAGALFVRWSSPFYVLCCINQIHAGALRGSGNSTPPTIIMLSSFVLFRQLYLALVKHFCNTVVFVALSYPAGWLVCSIAMCIYFYRSNWAERGVLTGMPKKA